MPKELAKKASLAAAGSVLQSLMPELIDRLDKLELRMERRFTDVDQRLEQLKSDMAAKFDQAKDVINELGLKIAKLEGRLDEHFENVRSQTKKMDGWLERIVKVEMMQASRARKAS